MKTCSYCGKEYPDEIIQCPVDAQPLSLPRQQTSTVSPVSPDEARPSTQHTSVALPLSDTPRDFVSLATILSIVVLVPCAFLTYMLYQHFGSRAAIIGISVFTIVGVVVMLHVFAYLPLRAPSGAHPRGGVAVLAYATYGFLLLSGVVIGLAAGMLTVGGLVGGFMAGRETQRAPEGYVYVPRGGNPQHGSEYSLTAPLMGILGALCLVVIGPALNIWLSRVAMSVLAKMDRNGWFAAASLKSDPHPIASKTPGAQRRLIIYYLINAFAFIIGIYCCFKLR